MVLLVAILSCPGSVRVRVLLRVLPDFHLSNVAIIYLEVEHGAMQNLKGKWKTRTECLLNKHQKTHQTRVKEKIACLRQERCYQDPRYSPMTSEAWRNDWLGPQQDCRVGCWWCLTLKVPLYFFVDISSVFWLSTGSYCCWQLFSVDLCYKCKLSTRLSIVWAFSCWLLCITFTSNMLTVPLRDE